MTARGLFVTGTDTGVGKTVVSVALLRSLVARGDRAVGMKPVASGIEPGAAVNADVIALAAAGNVDAPLADRNPYAFAPAIAPHIAAHERGEAIRIDSIVAAHRRLAALCDAVIVEGAGGALAPLCAGRDMLDIAAALELPVLIVVGVRLGCLNHAALTLLAVRARGLRVAGWVAARIDPGMSRIGENIAWLASVFDAPCAGDFPSAAATTFPDAALRTLGLVALRPPTGAG